MKILEITNYTKGGCGVGMRVLRESRLLADKGYEVKIFSTNREKGTEKICPSEEILNGVQIKRFPAVKLGGDSYMLWDFKKETLEFNPDLIIVHAYRHLHTTKALKLAKKLNCRIFLVTHAPFGREKSRSLFNNLIVKTYDFFLGKKINSFDKIITITHWEEKYLGDLGVKKNKIVYIPNGIESEFFSPLKIKPIKKYLNVIYIGRIAPIKQLETLINAIQTNKFSCKIIGPAESPYLNNLNSIIKSANVSIINKIYTKKEQIDYLDSSDVFVLSSKSEGMPQTLVEAMARGKIVIGSDNDGNKELIKDGLNGFIFKNGDSKDLERVLNKIKSLNKKQIENIQKNARKTSEIFKWDQVIDELEKILKN